MLSKMIKPKNSKTFKALKKKIKIILEECIISEISLNIVVITSPREFTP
jgi:hypothetical protein